MGQMHYKAEADTDNGADRRKDNRHENIFDIELCHLRQIERNRLDFEEPRNAESDKR